MKSIIILILFITIYSAPLAAKQIICNIDKNDSLILKYNSDDGSFEGFRDNEKLYHCTIKLIKKIKNSLMQFNSTGASTAIFEIGPCTQFSKSNLAPLFLKKGYLKYHSKNEVYLKLTHDNELRCKVMNP